MVHGRSYLQLFWARCPDGSPSPWGYSRLWLAKLHCFCFIALAIAPLIRLHNIHDIIFFHCFLVCSKASGFRVTWTRKLGCFSVFFCSVLFRAATVIEGCDGRLVQALLSDASRLECFSMFPQCTLSFCRARAEQIKL